MLTREENDLITRTGQGTPMGNLLREYWIPAGITEELPSPDCPPLRLRLLNEDLIAFRTTSGKIGVIADACPHRGASMFFGRNEEEGLRCVYHGWKFDLAGNCVDMPSEPAESNFKDKVKATAYRAQERNGLIWLYMGTRKEPPALPGLLGNLPPEGVKCHAGAYFSECNWMQSLEGDFDTIHVGFLHRGSIQFDEVPLPDENLQRYAMEPRWAYDVVADTEIGCTSGNYRPAHGEEKMTYWRIAQFLFPFYAMPPGNSDPHFLAVVPVDDEHSIRWNVGWSPRTSRSVDQVIDGRTTGYGSNVAANSTDWLGRFRPAGHRGNDYLIDRDVQRSNKGVWGFTGIPGRGQDGAVTESMGVIYQRNKEHLGVTDSGIIRMRRLLLKAARDLRDNGVMPPGLEKPELYAITSLTTLLPEGVNGIEATHEVQWKGLREEPSGLEIRHT